MSRRRLLDVVKVSVTLRRDQWLLARSEVEKFRRDGRPSNLSMVVRAGLDSYLRSVKKLPRNFREPRYY